MKIYIIIILLILGFVKGYISKGHKKFLEISSKYVEKYPELTRINHRILYNGYRPWAIKLLNKQIKKKKIELNEIQYIELKWHCLLGLEHCVNKYKYYKNPCFKEYAREIIKNEIEYGLRCLYN